ncbi:MAG: hypothetical protein RJA91_462 [Pseudomonadota bacterium]
MTDDVKPLLPILTTGFNVCAKLRRYAMAFEFKVETSKDLKNRF